MTDSFEKAFDNFLEEETYDDAEATLFALVRAAFLAGWNAAKAEALQKKNNG